jgi:hypothetical protein
MPPEITKFSDIKLRDYRSKKGCQGDAPVLKTKYTLNKSNKLFLQYAENTKNMIQNAANNQSRLLAVVNELFTYVVDPYNGKKVIRVNPKLTEESLQKAVEKARRLIVNLYVKCENDYTNGIKLYEAIVEAKILETTKNQIENLEKQAKIKIAETKKIVSPIPISKTIASQNLPAVVINEPSETITTSSSPITSSPSTSLSTSNTLSSSLTPSTTSATETTSSFNTSTIPSGTITETSIPSTDSNKNILNIDNNNTTTNQGLTENSYNSLPSSAISAIPVTPQSSSSSNTTLP